MNKDNLSSIIAGMGKTMIDSAEDCTGTLGILRRASLLFDDIAANPRMNHDKELMESISVLRFIFDGVFDGQPSENEVLRLIRKRLSIVDGGLHNE